MSKEVCGFNVSDKSIKINHICNTIFDKIDNIQYVEIIVKYANNLKIKPFSEWDKSKPSKYFGGKDIIK